MRNISSLSAIVTGASQGIGKSIAKALANEGVNTVLASKSSEKLEAAKQEIGKVDGNLTCIPLNLNDLSSLTQFVDIVGRQITQLDMLIHCGGIYASGGIDGGSIDQLDELYFTNVRGVYALTQSLLPRLIESRGDIVFVNSSIVHAAAKNTGQFAATQHALVGIANSVRAEVNDRGVRVLSVFPGRTSTPRQANIFAAEQKDYVPETLLQPEDIAEIIVACLKLPDTAEVVDLSIRPKQKW